MLGKVFKVPKPSGAGRQALLGVLAAVVLCGISLAGADHPPPPGFAILAAAIACWCAAVSLLRWRLRHRPHSAQLAVTGGIAGLGGVLGWLVLAISAAVVQGLGTDEQAWIGVAVAALLAAVGGGCLTLASWVFVDRSS